MNEIVRSEKSELTFEQMEKTAEIVAKSKLFPQWDSKEKVMTLMLLCKAEGSDPISAINRYDTIQGRVAKKSQAMLEDFVRCGGTVEWTTSNEKEAEAIFTPPGGKPLQIKITMSELARAGLTGKDNYKKYPAQMLRARLISNAMRMVFPSATNLLYSPEEVQDFTAAETQENIQPTKTIFTSAPPADTPTPIVPEVVEHHTPPALPDTIEERFALLDIDKVRKTLVAKFKKDSLDKLSDAQKRAIMANWDKFASMVEAAQ